MPEILQTPETSREQQESPRNRSVSPQFATKMVTASRNKKRLRQCANTVYPEPDHD